MYKKYDDKSLKKNIFIKTWMNFSLNFIRVSYGINTFSYLKYNIIYQISRRYIEYHIHFPIKIYLESKLKKMYIYPQPLILT